jgi:coenzyme PQQ biosynthesis protein PqqD
LIGLASRVRLAPKARLRYDEHSGKHVLLYPERGLELSDSAARIAALVAEERAVSGVVDALVAAAGAPRARIEVDVLAFLGELEHRGLLLVSEG